MGNVNVDDKGNFITDDNGRDRQSTPEEVDKTLREWDKDNDKKGKGK